MSATYPLVDIRPYTKMDWPKSPSRGSKEISGAREMDRKIECIDQSSVAYW